MNNAAHEQLIAAWDAGEPPPQALHGTIAMDDAYAMQLHTLTRRVQEGQQQTGWKLGQTNTQLRIERGEDAPAPGFMLAANAYRSGDTLHTDGANNWFLEPELAVVLRDELRGDSVDAQQVRAAVGSIASSFEVVRKRSGWEDRALLRAVNGSTAGYALGAISTGCPSAAQLDDLQVHCACNDETVAALRGGDANDNPLHSIAWLARFLARHDAALHRGQIILTGTYAGLLPISAGQRWRCQVGDLAAVELQVR